MRTSQQPGPSDRDRDTYQLSLNNWLTKESQQTNDGDDDGCSLFSNQLDTEGDTINVNVASILLEIRSDVKKMNKKFDSLEHSVNSLKDENKAIRKENEELKSSVTKLSEQMKLYEEKLSETELKQEKHDMALRKNNLKIYGMAFSENETASQIEQKLRNYFSTELGLNQDEPLLDYAYRLANKKDSPVLARFCALKSRDAVLNAFRHKRKQGHVTGRVVEDLPERIVKARTGLYPFLQQCISEKNPRDLSWTNL